MYCGIKIKVMFQKTVKCLFNYRKNCYTKNAVLIYILYYCAKIRKITQNT